MTVKKALFNILWNNLKSFYVIFSHCATMAVSHVWAHTIFHPYSLHLFPSFFFLLFFFVFFCFISDLFVHNVERRTNTSDETCLNASLSKRLSVTQRLSKHLFFFLQLFLFPRWIQLFFSLSQIHFYFDITLSECISDVVIVEIFIYLVWADAGFFFSQMFVLWWRW